MLVPFHNFLNVFLLISRCFYNTCFVTVVLFILIKMWTRGCSFVVFLIMVLYGSSVYATGADGTCPGGNLCADGCLCYELNLYGMPPAPQSPLSTTPVSTPSFGDDPCNSVHNTSSLQVYCLVGILVHSFLILNLFRCLPGQQLVLLQL